MFYTQSQGGRDSEKHISDFHPSFTFLKHCTIIAFKEHFMK